jgi:hypothetical protein
VKVIFMDSMAVTCMMTLMLTLLLMRVTLTEREGLVKH